MQMLCRYKRENTAVVVQHVSTHTPPPLQATIYTRVSVYAHNTRTKPAIEFSATARGRHKTENVAPAAAAGGGVSGGAGGAVIGTRSSPA